MGILVSLFLMLFSYRKFLFFFTLVIGTVLSISSDSWFGAWCGLELNLISFIPFIGVKRSQYSSEASLKYFLIQALGSAFVVLGAVLILISSNYIYILCIALLLKLGAAPVHFWFPQVIEGLSWVQCIILITIQKIAPIYLLSYCVIRENNVLVFISGIISAVVGALGGINQMLLRKLLAYSSINHISWIIFGIFMREVSWTLYFIFYSIMSLSVVLLFNYQQRFHLNQLTGLNKGILSLMRFLCILSLGGLPPFTGFIPKWIIIQEIVYKGIFLSLMVLLLRSLVTLYYYLRLIIIHIMLVVPKFKVLIKDLDNREGIPLLLFFNFAGLIFPSVFILI